MLNVIFYPVIVMWHGIYESLAPSKQKGKDKKSENVIVVILENFKSIILDLVKL